MSTLKNKIDFAVIVSVTNANPNGDPLNGNRPRESFDGKGEISDVCIKRKIRNRLQDMDEKIFIQSDDRCKDKFPNLKARAEGCERLQDIMQNINSIKDDITCMKEFEKIACEEWIDVRSFGQVFAFSKNKMKSKKDSDSKNDSEQGVSIGIRGPVTIQQAISISPVNITSMQITKSVKSEDGKKGASSKMGTKHRIDFGLYLVKGSINCQLAEKTGFSDDDAEKIKEALKTLFENDASSARPEGSMEVCRLYWWKHDCKTPKVSTAKVFRSIKISLKDNIDTPTCYDDYEIVTEPIEGLVEPEIYELV